MGMLLAHLNVAVPPYVRTDSFVLSHELGSPEGGSGSGGPQRVSISLSGTHGPSCPMPIVDSVEFSYPVRAKALHSDLRTPQRDRASRVSVRHLWPRLRNSRAALA